jgi:hypothetical protein
VIINPFQNDSIHTDIQQLEQAILRIFSFKNITQNIIFSNDYYNNTNQYRRIKTIQSNDGRFIGNSIFAVCLFIRKI